MNQFAGYTDYTHCARCGHQSTRRGATRTPYYCRDCRDVETPPSQRPHIEGITHNRNGYNWHGCRCDTCTQAAAQYRRQRHGTHTAYLKRGCRCRPCTDAYTTRRRQQQAAKHERDRKAADQLAADTLAVLERIAQEAA